MNRLGAIHPDSLSPEQKELYDAFDTHIHARLGHTFPLKSGDGVYYGPCAVQLHTPPVGQAWLTMNRALVSLPGPSAQAREVAVLVVAARTKAAFMQMAHSRMSGLPQADVEAIFSGRCPEHLDAQAKATYRLADESFKPGPLAKEVWEAVTGVLGVQGAVTIVQYVAQYKYVASILNCFDVQVPTGEM